MHIRRGPAGHILIVSAASHVLSVQIVSHVIMPHISRSGHADHLYMHRSYTLLMVHLVLPVVREVVVAERSSDVPTVFNVPLEHL